MFFLFFMFFSSIFDSSNNKEMKTKQKKTNSKVDSHKIDKDILLTKDFIKQYLKENLSISVDSDTNDFMSTDASTRTRVTATLILEDEEISSDSYTV